MANYQIQIRNKAGNIVGEFVNWRGLRFNEKLNNYGECSFTVPASDEATKDLIGLRVYETLVLRNGQVVWAGEQAARSVSFEANSSNRIEIISFTFLEMLNSRYTPRFVRYEEDQGQILKELVDDSQAQTNGDLGITFGSIPATKNRDRTYENYNIMQAWMNMSNVIDGVDFVFKPNKEVDILPRAGSDKARSIVFEWGTNIGSINVNDDFVNPGTSIIMLGSGFGSEQLIVTATDTTKSGIYQLRQQRFSEIDIDSETALTDKALGQIRKLGQPIRTVKLTQMPGTSPSFGSVRIGDIVRLKLDQGIYKINNNYRIYNYDVSIDDDNKETVRYFGGIL